MKPQYYILICALVIAALCANGGYLLSQEEFSELPEFGGSDTEHIIHREEYIPREDIFSFAVDSDRLFVFYEENALVNVYLLDGTFEYGIQISTAENGRAGIAVQDGMLYIKSRKPVAFIFENENLIEFVDIRTDKESLHKFYEINNLVSQEKTQSDGRNTYFLMDSKNDIVITETGATAFDFPEKSVGGDLFIFAFTFLGISVLMFDKICGKHNKRA